MDNKSITAVLDIDGGKIVKDILIPLNITVNELIIALNKTYNLGMDTNNISECYLRSENPTALLKGTKTIEQYGLRNASVIYYRKRR